MKLLEFIKTGLKYYFMIFLGGLILVYFIFKSNETEVNNSTSFLFLKEYIPKDSTWANKKIKNIELSGNYCENRIITPHKAVYDVIIKYEVDKESYVRYFMEQKDDTSKWVIIKKEIEPQYRLYEACE